MPGLIGSTEVLLSERKPLDCSVCNGEGKRLSCFSGVEGGGSDKACGYTDFLLVILSTCEERSM